MQKALLFKALITAALAFLLLWPLALIDGVARERHMRQDEVVREVQASYAGSQRLMGPVLVMPYREDYTLVTWEASEKGQGKVRREQPKHREGTLYLLPKQLGVKASLPTDFKRRGLFRTPVYQLEGRMQGRFELPATLPVKRHEDDSIITWGKPTLALPLDDTRGLARLPRLLWQEQAADWRHGSGIAALPNGIHARVAGIHPGKVQGFDFRIDLALRGSGQLGFVPLGSHTSVVLDSTWPHPSFAGRFLPDPQTQSIGPEGFHAEWDVTEMATSAPRRFLEAAASGSCEPGCLESFQIRLVEPVNIYSMADRALKYAFLFVGLGFAAFFLFELLTGLPIHPAQYLLMGLALALFFLLLLSLSEHTAFGLAYLGAAAASTTLLGYYLSYVLAGARRGLTFAGVLAALFAALYGLLVSEDNALLMGSLLLFGLLALAMISTRRFNWYALPVPGDKSKQKAAPLK